MKLLLVFVFCILQQTRGVIYTLNETEYDRLPPFYKLDEFYPCLRKPGDLYCYVDAFLVSNTKNELLDIIQEYSASTVTHYDHHYIHWGVCITKTCKDFMTNTTDLNTSIEACLNSSLTKTHQLQTRLVEDKVMCTKYEDPIKIDGGDIAVALVFITIVILNILGTLHDFCNPTRDTIASKLLLCFSVKQNWRRLVAPSADGPEPRLRRLKFFNGIKTLTTFLVVMGHAPLSAVIITNNPHFLETTYHNPVFHIFYSGHLIVQSFFIISGFLLAYNMLIIEEAKPISWEMLPKGIMLRWLRLTPPYAAVLAFVSTWLRHMGNGPMWKPTVIVEVDDCRRDWFYNLLYLNNYVDKSLCMGHTWYIASDMQLTILGLIIFCLLKNARARKIAIALAFIVGLATPAIHTVYQNLNAIVLLTPEVTRRFFLEDPTFNQLYKRGHTNIICYVIGLALGVWVYNVNKSNFDVKKYKKYRLVYWAMIPAGVLIVMSGGIFYIDGIQIPLAVRAVYASAVKLLFGLVAIVFIPGTFFKLDRAYRGLLEWNGWGPLGRVCYCAYLAHIMVIRTNIANQTSLIHSNFYQIFLNYFGLLVVTFIIAAPCWMLIEAPFGQLVKVCLNPAPRSPQKRSSKHSMVIRRKDLNGQL